MLRKAEASIRRGLLAAKGHAASFYRTGRSILNKVDGAYHVFKKLHGIVQPALGDYPVAAKQVKQAMSSYEQTRAKVVGANQQGEQIVSNIRSKIPELGL